ncbi:MAG: Clp protease ClpP [Lachnospiraceae bacterium]|nr:Clp protease ClpP [Lachnospiraceae bacterium]
MKKKFWNFIDNEAEGFELRLDGPISEDSWWGDEVTPQMFRDDLSQVTGDLTVWINSPGGDVFAADQIYTMLKEHPGHVTVKIDALAASAASVVAMAGDEVYMSPVSMMMVHDPSTISIGNESNMKETIRILKEVKETILNAYMAKTGKSHDELAALMKDDGTWMNAKKAVELGFADGILYQDGDSQEGIATAYSPYHVVNSLSEKVKAMTPGLPEPDNDPDPDDIEANDRTKLQIRMRLLGIRI